jgi:hypothetical protein
LGESASSSRSEPENKKHLGFCPPNETLQAPVGLRDVPVMVYGRPWWSSKFAAASNADLAGANLLDAALTDVISGRDHRNPRPLPFDGSSSTANSSDPAPMPKLDNADLASPDLNDASLNDAFLIGANLSDADLTGAAPPTPM